MIATKMKMKMMMKNIGEKQTNNNGTQNGNFSEPCDRRTPAKSKLNRRRKGFS